MITRNQNTHPLNTFVSSSKSNTYVKSSSKLLDERLQELVPCSSHYKRKFIKELPINFEPQSNEWKHLMTKPENQGNCGSCWAFSSTSCLTDRFNILSRKKILSQSLSPLTMILCNDLTSVLVEDNKDLYETIINPFSLNLSSSSSEACFGNSLEMAFYYLKFYGVSTQKCVSYNTKNFFADKFKSLDYGYSANQGEFSNSNLNTSNFTELSNFNNNLPVPSCFIYNSYNFQPFQFCQNNIVNNDTVYYGSPAQNYTNFLIYRVNHALKYPDFIKAEIYKWGPVCTSFFVYDDFYSFDPINDGVYIHDPNFSSQSGGHAVMIVGWGVYSDKNLKNIPFWWIKNSWGVDYGFNGYFRFLRGSNQCEIENNVLCLLPNLFINFHDTNYIKKLNNKLNQLNIFKITRSIEPSFYFVEKIFQSLGRYGSYIKIDTIRLNYKKFGLFYYEVINSIGFLQINNITISQYNTLDLLLLPGLDYSAPIIKFPVYHSFRAGSIIPYQESNIKKSNINFYFISIIIFTIILFFIIFLVFFLI